MLSLDGEIREIVERRRIDRAVKFRSGETRVSKYVFHRKGEPVRGFPKSWQKAVEKAGLPGRLFQDVRRSAIRNMVGAGVPERVTMAVSGHKTRSVFDRYNIVNEADIRQAVQRTQKYLGETPGVYQRRPVSVRTEYGQ